VKLHLILALPATEIQKGDVFFFALLQTRDRSNRKEDQQTHKEIFKNIKNSEPHTNGKAGRIKEFQTKTN